MFVVRVRINQKQIRVEGEARSKLASRFILLAKETIEGLNRDTGLP